MINKKQIIVEVLKRVRELFDKIEQEELYLGKNSLGDNLWTRWCGCYEGDIQGTYEPTLRYFMEKLKKIIALAIDKRDEQLAKMLDDLMKIAKKAEKIQEAAYALNKTNKNQVLLTIIKSKIGLLDELKSKLQEAGKCGKLSFKHGLPKN